HGSATTMHNKLRPALLKLSLDLPGLLAAQSQPDEPATPRANAAELDQQDFTDNRSFEEARPAYIAAAEDPLLNPDGSLSWDMGAYAFLDGAAPDTANPSLWRQAQLNRIHGLFRVTDGIYQIRGMDLANMTVVEGDSGLIIIDPLLTP